MSDDWRLRVDLHEHRLTHALTERLEASELEHDLETSFHDRVIVSGDRSEVFCYAGSRQQAERVEKLIRSLADEHGWRLDCELKRWHPAAEDWEDPDVPLPQADAQLVAERAALMERERAESAAQGYPEYEVRVRCPSHRDCRDLADKLRREGLRALHRWRYLLVGAADEDSADALAERIRREAPAGCVVTAEGNPRAILAERPFNPFTVFGGLAG